MDDTLTKIGFAHNLIKKILNGEKYKTYRYGDKYVHLNVGNKVIIWDSDTGKNVAIGEIINKSIVKFGDLPVKIIGHEPYASKKEQREIFKGFYGKEIGDDENMLVLEFKLVRGL